MDDILNKAVTIEFERRSKFEFFTCQLIDYPKEQFVKVKDIQGKIFLYPISKIENIKVLGDPTWQKTK